ncbi:EAL domain-containing protein [Modestobacter sp. VKM Ac-2979]|uniref:putative bifunctional diguanylate cyclase/phosphodiesterase n=1 Tax=unclassified Modestobacter TaxID=2643866 RepID=UPI0022ABAFBF|nr:MULTISPECIES: EAL domain-containing protein [unclassified Modestobacter]MCZ2810197.1 EAL domain-containing protein [Modestobacter sp. VKM Ac-2979]MCZ2841683.1 EAL domain-containing protein [Modestobacter sp. VKM Ac-2980]
MPRARSGAQLPMDVRHRDGGEQAQAGLVAGVLDALPSPTVLIDADGTMLLVNSAWQAAGDLLDDDRLRVGVGGNYFAVVLSLSDDAANRARIDQLRELSAGRRTTVSADYALATVTGVRWYHLQASRADRSGRVVVTHTDVTSRVEAERASSWQARHDHLTDLPNRAHLHDLISAELRRVDRGPVTVLFLDVDGFKDVNDTLGHEIGDHLLRELATRLTSRTRTQDTVGRLGGDEFVVLCRDCDVDGALALAERFQSTFDEPFDLGERVTRLTVSIGVATAPGDDPDLRSTDLVRDADLAMYAAKAAGRNRVRVFSPDLRSAVEQKVLVAAELREAIEAGQLVLHYQPVLHLPSGEVSGVEALVRWQHPERGLLSPCDFIPLAEQTGVVVQLTRWVLGEATRQAAAWERAGLSLVTGVNISAAHFATGTLVADVHDALDAAGLAPERLVLELTETSVAEDPLRAAAQFAQLRVTGVEVSIDDFGSGFSSLSQLVSIPAGVLKLDRSLIAGIEVRRSESAAAIAAVVGLAAACGMRSLAEGVETAGQLELVAELGCTHAQGFHIARPMPAAEVADWLAIRLAARRARRRRLQTA